MIADIVTWLTIPTLLLLNLPPFIGYTILGLLVMTTIILNGLALAKMRFSPLWAVLLLVPYLQIALFWLVAYKKWPVEKQR